METFIIVLTAIMSCTGGIFVIWSFLDTKKKVKEKIFERRLHD